jgi:hypothetical protein
MAAYLYNVRLISRERRKHGVQGTLNPRLFAVGDHLHSTFPLPSTRDVLFVCVSMANSVQLGFGGLRWASVHLPRVKA